MSKTAPQGDTKRMGGSPGFSTHSTWEVFARVLKVLLLHSMLLQVTDGCGIGWVGGCVGGDS